jgi:hypothetical protein
MPRRRTVSDELPRSVALNAYIGEPACSPLDDRASRWGARTGLLAPRRALAFDDPADPRDWADDAVGYGVLLADDPEVPHAAKAVGQDAPAAVRELMAARPDTVMLRWSPDLAERHLRRYFPDGSYQDPRVGLSLFGIGKGRLPRYIVIIGTPDQVPWRVQYLLAVRHAVGRLPLDDDGLDHYVGAMLGGFVAPDGDTEVDARAPLLWTVSHPGDITADMRVVVADPLSRALEDDRLPRFNHLCDASATGAGLVTALATQRPALLVTSSHGLATGERESLRAGLGLPVDVQWRTVERQTLIDAIPSGSMWFAQACCSAGSEGASKYPGLLVAGAVLDVIERVASLGSTVAATAVALLGRERPVRAVLGHVEPTFDWTLRDERTGQGLGGQLVAALSSQLHTGVPVGLAFKDYREGVGQLLADWQETYDRLNAGDLSVRPQLTRLRLTAVDRQSLVLLGDPTVTLPDLASAP